MPRVYLGVDGGQSSTVALIADDTGRVIGSGQGGPCNHVSGPEGRAKFVSAITMAIEQAAASAGLNYSEVSFAAACLGLSGGAEDKESYARELIRTPKLKVTHDAEIALSGATNFEPGIIVISGTGSIAFGRDVEMRTARAGGWGYIFGDEGGAFDIVRQALRASLRFEEGWGSSTALRGMLLNATGAQSADELLHRWYAGVPRAKIAALAPLVTEAANQGDGKAVRILDDAAAHLARFADAVHKMLFQHGEAVPVAYSGGAFRSAFLRTAFIANVEATIHCGARPARFGPGAGAVLEALRLDDNESALSDVPDCK